MSLIHRALQKLEEGKEEKKEEPSFLTFQDPVLAAEAQTTIETASPSKRESFPLLFGIVGILLLLFALGALVVFLQETRPPADPPARGDSQGSTQTVQRSTQAPAGSIPVIFDLTGVTHTGSDWIAIVNNQLVRVGESVSGAEVVSIQEREVTLNFNGRNVTLRL